MHEKTIKLFDCAPLSARMSRENCEKTRGMQGRQLKYNNDHEGVPSHMYEKCRECPGVQGEGAEVRVLAGPPRPERVAVFTIEGGYGYV